MKEAAISFLFFFFVFVTSQETNYTLERSEAFIFLNERLNRRHEKPSKIEVIPFGSFCRQYNAEVISFGPCSSKYLRCTGGGGYRIESCDQGEVVIDGFCQPASSSKTCLNDELNQLNFATIGLATSIRACDGFPGIMMDSKNEFSRQGLVCDPSVQPTAFGCPEGFSLQDDFSCKKIKPSKSRSSTTIKDALISAYCKYPPSEKKKEDNFFGFSKSGFDDFFCQNWFVDCLSEQFIFCENGKIYDKKNGYCRHPMADDKCFTQNCHRWEWLRVPLGSCVPEFVFCEAMIPNIFKCPEGKLFQDGFCVPSFSVAGCAICESGEKKKASHCREYFECRPYENPKDPWVLQKCPPGHHFNTQWKICEKSDDGACADYGACQDGESYSPQCGDYLICRHGDFHPGKCPHLTRWSKSKKICVPDENCKRYDTKENYCRPGDVIPSTDCEFYFICDAKTKTYEKRSCTDSAYERSSPCDYCRHSQPYQSPAEVSGFVCEEHSKFVDPTDCSRYIECVDSKFIQRICIEGSTFDSSSGRCSFKPKTPCGTSLENIKPIYIPPQNSEKDKLKFIFSPSEKLNNERKKIFKDNGDYCSSGSPLVADSHDCTVYQQCYDGFYRNFICPSNMYFNQDLQKCISDNSHCANPPAVCQPGSRISHPTQCGKAFECLNNRWKKRKCKNNMKFIDGRCSKTESCDQNPSTNYVNYDGNPKEYQIAYQDEKDCTRYYIVKNGQLIQKQCNNGQKFDESIGKCSYSYNCIKNKPNCYDGDTKPNPENCEKYKKCVSGIYYDVICPYGTHYSEHKKTCIEGSCYQQDENYLPENCIESPGLSGFRPERRNCQKFYQCAHGKWVPKDCPAGTAFAPELGVCNHIHQVPSCFKLH